MTNTHISISGTEPYGCSFYNSFVALYSFVGYEVEKLYNFRFSSAIDNIIGYQCKILFKTTKFFHTLYMVITEEMDYGSAASLIRMIADTLASYNLIYHQVDEEQKALRHYLFLLDGFSLRKKYFDTHLLKFDGRISEEEYISLKKRIDISKDNTAMAISVCLAKIRELILYNSQKENVEALISKHNWQYIDINKPKGHYKWEQLYEKIDSNKDFGEMISFMSQFVHGLSISNLEFEDDSTEFEPFLSYGIILMGILQNYVETDFDLTRYQLTDGILKSRHYEVYLSTLSKEKRNEIIEMLKGNQYDK